MQFRRVSQDANIGSDPDDRDFLGGSETRVLEPHEDDNRRGEERDSHMC